MQQTMKFYLAMYLEKQDARNKIADVVFTAVLIALAKVRYDGIPL